MPTQKEIQKDKGQDKHQEKTDHSAHHSSALYRKYRPSVFSEVRGQEDIVAALEGSIASGRIAHAYLFAGSRGTGKTTFARIFAKALKTGDNDIYEIDAASNRGIDDIRAIRDGVNILPFESAYKVYIVDEAHMLTKEAFNALLKTLEEPPKHVIFILATTEMEKLPETIVSRCQTFIFKRPSQTILRELVTTVAKKEGFSLEQGVAELIALLGDGSFRDTLGALQKVVSSQSTSSTSQTALPAISLAAVERISGTPKNVLVNDFLSALAKGDAVASISALNLVEKSAIDVKLFLELVIEKARFVLLLKATDHSPAAKAALAEKLSAHDAELVASLAIDPKCLVNSAFLAELLRACDETARANIPTLPLELAILRIAKIA